MDDSVVGKVYLIKFLLLALCETLEPRPRTVLTILLAKEVLPGAHYDRQDCTTCGSSSNVGGMTLLNHSA